MRPESKEKRCTFEADLRLVKRHRNGDLHALDELFQSHRPLILFWIRRVWSWADREEVMQEVRIGLSKAAMEFDASKNDDFHGQVRSCVMNAVFNSRAVLPVRPTLYRHYRDVLRAQDELMRKLDRRPTLGELADAAELSERQVETALNVIAAFPFPLEAEDGQLAIEEPYHVEDPYQSQLIKDALKQLSRYDRMLIIRFYYYGETDPEIGADLDKSDDAVKVARNRALERLRDIISDEGV